MIEYFNNLPEMSRSVIVSSVAWVLALWVLSPVLPRPAKLPERNKEPVVHYDSVYVADLTHSKANAFTLN